MKKIFKIFEVSAKGKLHELPDRYTDEDEFKNKFETYELAEEKLADRNFRKSGEFVILNVYIVWR